MVWYTHYRKERAGQTDTTITTVAATETFDKRTGIVSDMIEQANDFTPNNTTSEVISTGTGYDTSTRQKDHMANGDKNQNKNDSELLVAQNPLFIFNIEAIISTSYNQRWQ